MTTLAIIGSGILGRSLIYTLAKEQKQFEKIVLFYSDNFAFPCTLHSTAIAAPRGLTEGTSPLGDKIMAGFRTFSEHVSLDQPSGVESIIQYTGATRNLDQFKTRYPAGKTQKLFLQDETYVAQENAFLIDPETYGNWLLSESKFMEQDHFEMIEDFVVEVSENERLHLKTQNGRNLSFDKVVFAGGNYNRFWTGLAPDSKLKTIKPVQGSYYEFNGVDWEMPSFSLTLDGDNLVWNQKLKRVLVGSTSMEGHHTLPDEKELIEIYSRLKQAVNLKLPSNGIIKTGLREKAQKREPYLFSEGNKIFAGGLYKNGFSLSLEIARSLSHQHL